MDCGVTYDAAFICSSPSPPLDRAFNNVPTCAPSTLLDPHTLRWDVQGPGRAEDEVSSEVGPGDSRSACTRSASPQPLVRVSFSPRKESILPKSYVRFCQGLTPALPSRFPLGFSDQLSRSSSSHSSIPEFIYSSQKTSINRPVTSSSALTPASTSSTPISLSQTLNAFRCCDKTFRRPCDLRFDSLPIFLYQSPTNCEKIGGTQKSTPDLSNAPSAALAPRTAGASTATPSQNTLTSPRCESCTTAPSRRVRRNTSQPVATTVPGTLQRCTKRRGDTDEGAGGNQGRSRWWAVDFSCQSGQMSRGGTAGQEPYARIVFSLVL